MFEQDVKCSSCGFVFLDDWSRYIMDSNVVDDDPNDTRMGSEVEHIIECDEYICPHCRKRLRVFGSVWEYPLGGYNHHQLDTEVIEEL